MAAKTALNEKNLRALGVERLAKLVLEMSTGDAALKRQARSALLEQAGGDALANEMRKRFLKIRQSSSFVDWNKQHAFFNDLERQHTIIIEKIAPNNPTTALELMWQFLELAGPVHEQTDDSDGSFGEIFREACSDLGPLMTAAKSDPIALAKQVFSTAVTANDYGQYDSLISHAVPALGEDGLAHLKTLVLQERTSLGPGKSEPKSSRTTNWDASSSSHRSDFERDSHKRALRYALQEIADAEGDVDSYIAEYDEETRTVPSIAAEIAIRLLDAGRPDEAMIALDQTKIERSYIPREWVQVRLTTLEALGRNTEAQTYRWQQFETSLDEEYLRAYLKQLPDFEDIEAEGKALDIVQDHKNKGAALAFFINWPSLERAAVLVLKNHSDWDGNDYYLLTPSANALEGRYPLAATILRREMISYTLGAAKATRYKHTARHLLECESLVPQIDDFQDFPTHDEFTASLKRDHVRKTGFWKLLPTGSPD